MDLKYFLVIAVLVVMGWFAVGIIYNLRRGDAILRWMQAGLPMIGERTTFRWLGTSVAELVIAQAKRPFRRMETLVVLTPRDVPWMWLWAALRGRRDTLIFRANLSTPPEVDLEFADPASWTGRVALQEAAKRGWDSQSYQGLQLMAPPGKGKQASTYLSDISEPGRRLASSYWRFSVRRGTPHLELHFAFPDQRSDAKQFFEAFQRLAIVISEHR